MQLQAPDRRSFLKTVGAAGMLSALPESAFALDPGTSQVAHEVAAPGPGARETKRQHQVRRHRPG